MILTPQWMLRTVMVFVQVGSGRHDHSLPDLPISLLDPPHMDARPATPLYILTALGWKTICVRCLPG